jgi:hypothetical protein
MLGAVVAFAVPIKTNVLFVVNVFVGVVNE